MAVAGDVPRPLTSLRLGSGPLGRGDNLRGLLRALHIENKWTRRFDAAGKPSPGTQSRAGPIGLETVA